VPADRSGGPDLEVMGVVHILAAFIPGVVDRGEAVHIVVTASLASYLTTPFGRPYFASKHAVLSIVETLRLQLAAAEIPIGVSVLCPDQVRTRAIERELIHRYGQAGRRPAPTCSPARTSSNRPRPPRTPEPCSAVAVYRSETRLWVVTCDFVRRVCVAGGHAAGHPSVGGPGAGPHRR
jgi:NAD(P)-dependent dehydrogenase (short-subunit alcohol dehydrogenase family)